MSDNLALSDIMLFMKGMTGNSVPDAENHAPKTLRPPLARRQGEEGERQFDCSSSPVGMYMT
jgi:hypothetical protein